MARRGRRGAVVRRGKARWCGVRETEDGMAVEKREDGMLTEDRRENENLLECVL